MPGSVPGMATAADNSGQSVCNMYQPGSVRPFVACGFSGIHSASACPNCGAGHIGFTSGVKLKVSVVGRMLSSVKMAMAPVLAFAGSCASHWVAKNVSRSVKATCEYVIVVWSGSTSISAACAVTSMGTS